MPAENPFVYGEIVPRTAFIDRRSRPFGETPHQPDIFVPTMKDLADAIV